MVKRANPRANGKFYSKLTQSKAFCEYKLTRLAWDTSWDENNVATGNGSLDFIANKGGDLCLGVNVGEIGTDAGSDGVDVVARDASDILVALQQQGQGLANTASGTENCNLLLHGGSGRKSTGNTTGKHHSEFSIAQFSQNFSSFDKSLFYVRISQFFYKCLFFLELYKIIKISLNKATANITGAVRVILPKINAATTVDYSKSLLFIVSRKLVFSGFIF